MTSAQDILDIARGELGTAEAADGSTKYHRAYGLPFDQAWCAAFVWWVFRQAGAGGLIHPKTAYTPTLLDWFKARGQASSTPKVGDLVLYNWRNGTRAWPLPQHVGIVEAVEPTSTIQGNGGSVMRRRRARNNLIVSYAHPAYTAASATLGVVERTQMAVDVSVDGIWGPSTDRAISLVRAAAYMDRMSDVQALQRAIETTPDGIWGPASEAALTATVRALQAAWGTGADGIWGPGTDKAWAAARGKYGRGLIQPAPVVETPQPVTVDIDKVYRAFPAAQDLMEQLYRSLPPAA